MESTTLYYAFSAMPQVIGTIAAIMATFTFFRISNLHEYLIGDGRSVLSRQDEIGYKFPDLNEHQLQYGRMRDAVDRKSVPEIKNVISRLQELEKAQGHTRQTRPNGLQYLYEERFCGTEKHINRLKKWATAVVALSFLSIASSIISLALIDLIMSSECTRLKYIILWLNVIIFVASLVLAFYLLYLALYVKTVHEIDRQVA